MTRTRKFTMAGYSSNLHCCVPKCTSDSRYESHISFHAFPKDEAQKKKWIAAIRRDEGPLFKITKTTVVCGKHFLPEEKRKTICKTLLNGAVVPSLFAWTNAHPRKPPKQRPHQSNKRARKVLADVKLDQQISAHPDELLDDEHDLLPTIEDRIHKAEEALKQKQEECKHLQEINAELQSKISLDKFGINRFGSDNNLIRFYTGFRTYTLFCTFFSFIQPGASSMQSVYYVPSDSVSLRGRPRSMLLIDELFMFLCRLRAGLHELDLSVRFNIHVSSVSRKLITWANFLYIVLGSMPLWPSREQVDRYMPSCFRRTYPTTRVILDCTEIKTQYPSSMTLNSKTYSYYKSTNTCTFKSLIGITPHGAVTFVSCLYTGCMSDVEIVELSGILDLLEPGDSVMADKGFTISNKLREINVGLNIPPFLHSQGQFTKSQVEETETIASVRIHVERAIRRVKENHLFDTIIPLNLVGTINQLWTVAALLTNYEGPLIQEK